MYLLGKLAIVAAVCSLAAVATLASPQEALAFSGPTPYESLRSGNTTYLSKFLNLLKGGSTTQGLQYGTLIGGETTTTQAGTKSMLYRARTAAGFLPRLGVVATRLSLIGTAGYIGWRVYQHFWDGTEQQIDLWLDSNALGKDALANGCAVPLGGSYPTYTCGEYKWVRADLVKESTAANCSIVGTNDCWVLELNVCWDANESIPNCDGIGSQRRLSSQNAVPAITAGTTGNDHRRFLDVDQCVGVAWDCYNGQDSGSAAYEAGIAWMHTRTQENLIGRVYDGTPMVDDTLTHTVGVGTGIVSHKLVLPDTALGPSLSVNPGDGGTLTTPDLTTDPHNVGEPTTEEIADALDALEPVCGQTLVNHIALPTIFPWIPGCIEVAPDSPPEPETFLLPRPMANETYADYILRLQDAGWVGAATLIELDPFDPTVGPEAVPKLGVTGSTGTWRRVLWPVRSPELAITTDLTIYHNPVTAPPVAPDPTDEDNPTTNPDGGIVGSGECEPWLEADPDFSPLQGLDYGSKFPFGLFTWAGGILGSFSTTPDAPSWQFDISIPSTAVSPSYAFDFDVDLNWFDAHMETVRTILSFVLWVGAVWFFATGLLGFRVGSNPAEAAADDA